MSLRAALLLASTVTCADALPIDPPVASFFVPANGAALNGWEPWAARRVIPFTLTVRTPADTARPAPLPPLPGNRFDFPRDTLVWPITPPDPVGRTYRTVADLWFETGATAANLTHILTKYNATVYAGEPGGPAYVLRFPNPGPTSENLLALLDALTKEPGVRVATSIAYSAPIFLPRSEVHPLIRPGEM